MIRHTAFFMLRPDSTPEQQLWMLKGLAHMRFHCESVVALDCGSDLFGGSRTRLETDPWKRTPRWRSQEIGPPCNYDVALMLDFDDMEGMQAYNVDDTHHEVGVYNASIAHGEITARTDWEYEGAPRITRGHVRHSAMFVWDGDISDSDKEQALEDLRSLEAAKGVESLVIGKNFGKHATDYDFIVDIAVPDKDTAAELINGKAYADVMAKLAPVVQLEWTARMSHVMRGV